jgi:SPP1 family predicted phage head-tail adaptor/HK97 gp10 family phage protein
MEAGELDRKIRLERPDEDVSAYGENVITWISVGEVWAKVKGVGGYEAYAASQRYAEATHEFTVRFRKDLTTKYRVSYQGQEFDILHLVEIGRRLTVKFTGFEKAAANLAELGPELAKLAIDNAVKSVAENFADAVSAAAPVGEGGPGRKHLKDSIVVTRDGGAQATTVNQEGLTRYFIYPNAPHAHLVEFGHRLVSENGQEFGFVAPRPFVRPAYLRLAPIYSELISAELALNVAVYRRAHQVR